MVVNPNGAREGSRSAQTIDWDAAHRSLSVQVYGAAGAVGRELVAALLKHGHPARGLALFGRHARTLGWQGLELAVRPVPPTLLPARLAFLCTPPEVARQLAQALLAQGTRVIDLSGGHRWRRDVPMVEPGINMNGLGTFTQLVTLPGRTSALVARPLWALERAAGLAEVVCTVLRSSASEGTRGMLELRRQLQGAAAAGPPVHGLAEALPAWAGNLIPAAGDPLLEGSCAAESEIVWDLRQLFLRPDLPVDVSAVQVGVERCDGFALTVLLKRPLTPAGAAQAMAAVAGLRVVGSATGPTAADCVRSEEVHVGRIRTGSRGPASLSFFAVGDQLRMGAVLSALEVAARLPDQG